MWYKKMMKYYIDYKKFHPCLSVKYEHLTESAFILYLTETDDVVSAQGVKSKEAS
jgi:hypothetical protein